MTQIDVRLGIPDEVAAAASVYERSNLARRDGDWPSRSARVAQVTASLHADTSWFLIGRDGACLDAPGTIAQGQHRPPPASLNR